MSKGTSKGYQTGTSATEVAHLVAGEGDSGDIVTIEATKEEEFRFNWDLKPVYGYYAKIFLFGDEICRLGGQEAKNLFDKIKVASKGKGQ